MKRSTTMGGLVVMAALTLGASAEQSPNFTGVWSAVTDAPETLPAAPGAIFGGRFEFKHNGQRLTVIRPVRDVSVSTEYGLDGGEVKNVIPGAACFGDSASLVSVTLKGQSISYRMVASLPPGGGAPTPLTLTYAFRMRGPDMLEVESVMRVAGDPNPRTVATVYKRTTDPMPAPAKPIVAAAAPATMADVAWIAGTWVSAGATSSTEERWTPATGGSMLAISRTHRATSGAQTAFEFLCIAERAGSLVYTAMPNARTPATDFMLTAKDAQSVTFENPAHDFPKMIRYTRRADGGLDATISVGAGQRETTFSFKKQ